MNFPSLLSLLAVGLSAQAAAQTATRPFPLTPLSSGDALSGLVHHVDQDAIATLDDLQQVRLQSMVLPGGQVVDLDLRRIDVARRKFGYQLNGRAAGDLLAGTELSLWKGSVRGQAGTDVMLSFSKFGTRGWIHLGSDVVHLMPRPDADGSWTRGDVLITTESALNAAGLAREGECSALDPLMPPARGSLDAKLLDDIYTSSELQLDTCAMFEAEIAMETDYQLYRQFNSVPATSTYLVTLLSFISDRFELQANTVLTFPYLQIYSSPNDPWSTPDNGGDSLDMLNEFIAAWAGNIPGNASLGHMMSGADLGGGVAYLDTLCNDGFGFGVSGNIAGQVQFPVMQQPNNWDFMVVAHELGHNFSSPHTHNFCPPLDECASSAYFGNCQNQQICTNQGTVMSYCHQCPGSTANITTYFHPQPAALMALASANSCNAVVYELIVDHPAFLSSTAPTPTSVTVIAGSVSNVQGHYRLNGAGAFTSFPMASQGNGVFASSIPPVDCSDTAEIYYSFDVAGMGTLTCPTDAPTSGVYTAGAGTLQVTFADDFETDQGWATAVQGSTSGAWERGVPINDVFSNHDPVSDFDGSGSCYLTENDFLLSGVAGGVVTLTSPAMDLSNPDGELSYAYYLKMSNADGTDHLAVEANAGGGWVEVARHDSDGGLDWRTHAVTHAQMVAAGLAPGATTQIRFLASEGGDPSILEAAIDAIQVSIVTCDDELGISFCGPAEVNSTGQSAVLAAAGSSTVSSNNVTLTAEQLPPSTVGLFLTSPLTGFVAGPGGSQGNLCLGGAIGRFNTPAGYGLVTSSPSGEMSLPIELGSHPTPNGNVSMLAGQTHHFQAWFSDMVGGVPTSNFTNGLTVVFQ